MGFCIQEAALNDLLQTWRSQYRVYAPKVYPGGGRFSDTDCIRYGEIQKAEEIVFDKKSEYSSRKSSPLSPRPCSFSPKMRQKKPMLPQKEPSYFSEAAISMH